MISNNSMSKLSVITNMVTMDTEIIIANINSAKCTRDDSDM
jgi:hypothetical protein